MLMNTDTYSRVVTLKKVDPVQTQETAEVRLRSPYHDPNTKMFTLEVWVGLQPWKLSLQQHELAHYPGCGDTTMMLESDVILLKEDGFEVICDKESYRSTDIPDEYRVSCAPLFFERDIPTNIKENWIEQLNDTQQYATVYIGFETFNSIIALDHNQQPLQLSAELCDWFGQLRGNSEDALIVEALVSVQDTLSHVTYDKVCDVRASKKHRPCFNHAIVLDGLLHAPPFQDIKKGWFNFWKDCDFDARQFYLSKLISQTEVDQQLKEGKQRVGIHWTSLHNSLAYEFVEQLQNERELGGFKGHDSARRWRDD